MATTEEHRFQDYFGVPVIIGLLVWKIMTTYDHLTAYDTIAHFLRVLHFMKVYLRQDEGSAATGGSGGAMGPKTWRKYSWLTVYGLSLPEQRVVRGVTCPKKSKTTFFAVILRLAHNLSVLENLNFATLFLEI